jgi:hypothetical protein
MRENHDRVRRSSGRGHVDFYGKASTALGVLPVLIDRSGFTICACLPTPEAIRGIVRFRLSVSVHGRKAEEHSNGQKLANFHFSPPRILMSLSDELRIKAICPSSIP